MLYVSFGTAVKGKLTVRSPCRKELRERELVAIIAHSCGARKNISKVFACHAVVSLSAHHCPLREKTERGILNMRAPS